MKTFDGQTGMLREPARHSQIAPGGSAADGMSLWGPLPLPWRALLAAALLSLALGAGVYEGLGGGRLSVAPAAARSHAFSQKGLLSLPLAAQGPVAAALGANNPAYRVSADPGGFSAASPAQHLSTTFASSGVSISTGATHVGLSLRAVGYGSVLSPIAATAPHARGNRIVYSHSGVSEWYANGPLGLEQGFTLATAPAGREAGPLTLVIALSGNVRALVADGGQRVTFTRAGKATLRYRGLMATDARGHLLRSWLALDHGRLLLRVDATGARYPLRIDPFVEQAKLNGNGTGNAFGITVALSSDGDTALVGNCQYDEGVGAAVVFTRSGSTWTEQEKLKGPGESPGEGLFGESVALSEDGNTVLIGGPWDHGKVGAAWAFTRSGFGQPYTLQGSKLTASGEVGEGQFGFTVALSSDGDTALIGAPEDNSHKGAVSVFTRPSFGSNYSPQEELTPIGGLRSPKFGESLALSSDGNTALISGPYDNEEHGAVWVFTRPKFGEAYGYQEKLAGGHATASVALSSDGNTALMNWSVWTRASVGAAYVYQEELRGGGTDGINRSDALAEDGNVALIGTALWVRSSFGGAYTKQEELSVSGNPNLYGIGVALTENAKTAIIGSEADAAWVFENVPKTPTSTTGPAAEVTTTSITLNATVNPDSATVTDCEFEYGTTTSYGESAPCSPSPDSGGIPVAVSVALTGLTVNTTYHYRIVATNAYGTSEGSDRTFTTLLNVASGTSNGTDASATEGPLTATASGSAGTLTVGQYGSDPAGAPSFMSSGEYIDVYLSSSNSFTRLEFTDCELNGGDSVYWWNPQANSGSGEWQGVSDETAPSGSPPCITVAVTNATSPNLGQMTETIFGSGTAASPTAVTGTASSITPTSATVSATVNPNGVAVSECELEYGTSLSYGHSVPCSPSPGLGSSPITVSASLTGLNASTTYHFRVVATNSAGIGEGSDATFATQGTEFGRCVKVAKGDGAYKTSACDSTQAGGSYEWEPGVLKAHFKTKLTSGSITLESAVKTSKMTCTGETSNGEYTGLKTVGGLVLTLTGCTRGTEKCSSVGAAAGEIVTKSLEGQLGFIEREPTASKDKIGLDLNPAGITGLVVEFSCGSTVVSVQGSVIVPVKANKMSVTQALKFKASKGRQTPERFEGVAKDILEESFNGGTPENTGLKVSITQTSEEDVEVNSVA
jgi:FG-GAP repeat